MKKLNHVLERMGDRTELHALFLNTLSLLEYIGARKIIKSQLDRTLNEELLGHIAEEIRHAQILKHLALKLSEGSLRFYHDRDLLCGQEGKAYIQTVDYAVETALLEKDQWKNYLLTTLLIEERAAIVYPIYNSYLGTIGLTNKLTSIIRDEDKHLKSVVEEMKKSHANFESIMGHLRKIEDVAFEKFMDTILLRLG